jgi:GGDEF domain-containing protein
MPLRKLTVLTADEQIRNACTEAAQSVPQAISEVQIYANLAELESAGPTEGLLVVDPDAVQPMGLHEWSLSFLQQNRCLLLLLTHGNNADADGLARFVGAQGALSIPVDVASLADHLASPFGASSSYPSQGLPEVDEGKLERNLGARMEAILQQGDVGGREEFVLSITDSETGLYTFEYWEHRLEEEYKRSNRFRFPLGLVAFKVDGMLGDDKLLDVASIILLDTRDVDVVTRYDDQTFLALLPHTGPEGARLFGQRVCQGLSELKLVDLVGESTAWSSSTHVCPDSNLTGPNDFLNQVVAQNAQV